MQKYSALFTDVPYMADTVNHATKNEQLRLQSLHIWLVQSTMQQVMKRRRFLTLYLACDTAEERMKAGSKNSTQETSERHDVDRAATKYCCSGLEITL